jgi:hypothetical protein
MTAPSVDDLAHSFERYLRAGNKSPRTSAGVLGGIVGHGAMGGPGAETGADHREREAEQGEDAEAEDQGIGQVRADGATTSPSTSSLPSIA